MHSDEHDDRCLLYHSGELAPEDRAAFEAELAACEGCREFLASLRKASRLAAEAAVEPPHGLAERTSERVLAERGMESPPLFTRRSLGFALAFAALAIAVYVFGPRRAGEQSLNWTNGIERDLARTERKLQALSRDIAVGTDPAEIDSDLRGLEESARKLEKQLL
ncbi:MAG: hypothetical protein HY922_16355 [Elusimicrobia bacterium]|nr:hypothetical protein [Elusimicrobiota bacterium]